MASAMVIRKGNLAVESVTVTICPAKDLDTEKAAPALTKAALMAILSPIETQNFVIVQTRARILCPVGAECSTKTITLPACVAEKEPTGKIFPDAEEDPAQALTDLADLEISKATTPTIISQTDLARNSDAKKAGANLTMTITLPACAVAKEPTGKIFPVVKADQAQALTSQEKSSSKVALKTMEIMDQTAFI